MTQPVLLSGFADQLEGRPTHAGGRHRREAGASGPIRDGHVEDIHVHRQAAFNDQSPLEGPLAGERRLLVLAIGVTVATGRFC